MKVGVRVRMGVRVWCEGEGGCEGEVSVRGWMSATKSAESCCACTQLRSLSPSACMHTALQRTAKVKTVQCSAWV